MTETVDTLQDLIFVLEHSLRQPEWYLWKMPFWQAKKRFKQIMAYEEIQEKKMKENSNESKPRSVSKNKRKF